MGQGLRFILHLLSTLHYNLVYEAAFGQLHALCFAGRMVARVLEQTVVFVIVRVSPKQPVAVPNGDPWWGDSEDRGHLIYVQHACFA